MTDQGYRNRLFAIEWLANLWLRYGTPIKRCEQMRAFCSECLDADYYGMERPATDDAEIMRAQSHFDHMFSRGGALVSWE
jgi:hypothetical protein